MGSTHTTINFDFEPNASAPRPFDRKDDLDLLDLLEWEREQELAGDYPLSLGRGF